MGKAWWKQAAFYELYVDKFAGNFKGLTARLDYFSRLGIDCLHILPHYPSPMIDDGYDIADYRGVRPELGTLEDFKTFIREAHARGLRVMTDLVINHVSSKHPWFIEARSSQDNPKRDYFLWSKTGKDLHDSLNIFPHLKASNWSYNPTSNDYYFATFYAQQPDLNWDNPQVVKEMLAIIDFWIDMGVDAFRIDAASHLVKREGTNGKGLPETHAILRTVRAHIEARSPQIALLAEVFDTPERTCEYFGNDDECQLVYHFPLAERMILAAFHNNPQEAAELFASTPAIPEHCQWAIFLRSHDELLLTHGEHQEFIAACDPEHKYVFKEDGLCMRLGSIFKHDPARIRLAFDMLLSFPAAPIIYYGEEIGMENDDSIGLPLDRRRYVRGAFDWEKAQAQMNDPNSLFSFIARLLAKRKAVALPSPALEGYQEVPA